MEPAQTTPITIETTIQAPVDKVWRLWTAPEHITKWNTASDDWHTPRAESDLRAGGSFSCRREAKDGSFGFDFGGVYDVVDQHQRIAYTMSDGRKVDIRFEDLGNATKVTETF